MKPGFFAWVDGAPAEGYRARRGDGGTGAPPPAPRGPTEPRPVAVITGEYGAMVLAPLLAGLGRPEIRLLAVKNSFFGGNIAVTGLLTGVDIAGVLAGEPAGPRYLLPDVCLSEGRFLDGMTPAELPRTVEIVPTDGLSLRLALAGPREGAAPPGPAAVPVALRHSR